MSVQRYKAFLRPRYQIPYQRSAGTFPTDRPDSEIMYKKPRERRELVGIRAFIRYPPVPDVPINFQILFPRRKGHLWTRSGDVCLELFVGPGFPERHGRWRTVNGNTLWTEFILISLWESASKAKFNHFYVINNINWPSMKVKGSLKNINTDKKFSRRLSVCRDEEKVDHWEGTRRGEFKIGCQTGLNGPDLNLWNPSTKDQFHFRWLIITLSTELFGESSLFR